MDKVWVEPLRSDILNCSISANQDENQLYRINLNVEYFKELVKAQVRTIHDTTSRVC